MLRFQYSKHKDFEGPTIKSIKIKKIYIYKTGMTFKLNVKQKTKHKAHKKTKKMKHSKIIIIIAIIIILFFF